MTTAKGVLQELDELRAILAKPMAFAEVGSPARSTELAAQRRPLLEQQHRSWSSSRAPGAGELWRRPAPGDRLGRAMEAAEDEVDAAAGRAQEVHRSMMWRKEQEVAELQRALTSKERAAQAAQDQAAALRRGYEQRLAAAESAATRGESEAGQLRAEVLALRAERDDLQQRVRDADAAAAALESEAASAAEAMGARLQSQGRELAAAAAAAQRERRDKELLQLEARELRRELEAAEAEARAAHAEAASMANRAQAEAEARRGAEAELDEARAQASFLREAKARGGGRIGHAGRAAAPRRAAAVDLEVAELRRRLSAERGVRKACERWLRAELRTREEMEALLLAVRDTAFGRPPRRGDEARGVEVLLDSLRAGPSVSAACGDANAGPPPAPGGGWGAGAPRRRRGGEGAAAAAEGGGGGGGGGGGVGAGAARREFEELKRQLQSDGARLKEQVLAAKALLRERLGRAPAGAE
ncbi:MAG: hypothetical protein J3K34DRAFT_521949 [Monoraphidium minutum]|nr:MAG: hypothetical protein J3K34DRAFT_521949 [Monoraphidium minutum]